MFRRLESKYLFIHKSHTTSAVSIPRALRVKLRHVFPNGFSENRRAPIGGLSEHSPRTNRTPVKPIRNCYRNDVLNDPPDYKKRAVTLCRELGNFRPSSTTDCKQLFTPDLFVFPSFSAISRPSRRAYEYARIRYKCDTCFRKEYCALFPQTNESCDWLMFSYHERFSSFGCFLCTYNKPEYKNRMCMSV